MIWLSSWEGKYKVEDVQYVIKESLNRYGNNSKRNGHAFYLMGPKSCFCTPSVGVRVN